MAEIPKFNDHLQVLVYKLAKISEGYSTNPLIAKFNDHLQVLAYKAATNLGGGSGGGTSPVVAPPANTTDFSTLPGGVSPEGDTVYFAPRDSSTIWTIAGGDAAWTIIDKNIP